MNEIESTVGGLPKLGPFLLNKVYEGDCLNLIPQLPDESIDVVVTSPPYWGQRLSLGTGIEEDPRHYLEALKNIFLAILPKLKETGILWINLGDAYNTPVNWRLEDREYSTLGANSNGLAPDNSAYTKPRAKRRAFIDPNENWLQYGNLLALPLRLILSLCESGYLYRSEVIWIKRNPMPEGRARRPHRSHEGIYLLTKSERHSFQTNPPVKSTWDFSNEKIDGVKHFSRFPEELPRRCIAAYGVADASTIVLDPFAGSGTTGVAAKRLGCSFIGFELDNAQVVASNSRLDRVPRRLFSF
jgi:DNA modification methylase